MRNEENKTKKDIKGQGFTKNKASRLAIEEQLERGKIPPQALDLEEAVLGAIMIDNNALVQVVDMLAPDVFYSHKHQTIYRAIEELFKRKDAIDLLTVTQQLRKSGELETVGGAYYLSQLTSRIASTAHLEYHARILLEKYMLRELIRTSSAIINDAYKSSTDVFNLLDEAESNLFAISEKNFHREYSNMENLVKEAIEEINAANNSTGSLSGLASGFTGLDRITAGWQKSDLIILAARPGMGKTAFVLSMARHMAVEEEYPLAIFSLEMSAVQLTTRLISSETEIPAGKLKKGNLESYEWDALSKKVKRLTKAPIFIDDTPALSIFELRAKARRLKSQHDIKMIIIDYIQLMTSGNERASGNREQEISTISRSLKSLAKELEIPVIALSQLNRSVETRTGSKRPLLSDLRESGAIEQDADLVLFIYRPEYYGMDHFDDKQEIPSKGMAEIIIAKHRNGPLDSVLLRFKGSHAKFLNYIPEQDGFSNYQEGMETENVITLPSKMNTTPPPDEGFAPLEPMDEQPF